MKYLFKNNICDWKSWGKVFNSIDAFSDIIKKIFAMENIDFNHIELCTPGTNAVFRVGNYVVKIYAPKESGMNTESDYFTECFGMERAEKLNILTPNVVAKGIIEDRYKFLYLIMEYIQGDTLGDIEDKLTDDDKFKVGEELRTITEKLNTVSEPFNRINIIERELNNKRWNIFTESFNEDRVLYLKKLHLDNLVYVHGDINPDNVLITKDKKLYLIDFADAHTAPKEYEIPPLVCETFCFEKSFMKGYFGEENPVEIMEQCIKGLLIHDFGSYMIKDNLGNIRDITSINILKEKLYDAITNRK